MHLGIRAGDLQERSCFERYIHPLVLVPPELSVGKLMQNLKGKTSHKMLFELCL